MTPIETYTLVLRTLRNQLAPVRIAVDTAPISEAQKATFNSHVNQLLQNIASFPSFLQQGRFELAEQSVRSAIGHYRDALVFAQSVIYPAVAEAAAQSVSWERLLKTLPPSLRPPSMNKIKKALLIGGLLGVGGFFVWRSYAKSQSTKVTSFVSEHPEILSALA